MPLATIVTRAFRAQPEQAAERDTLEIKADDAQPEPEQAERDTLEIKTVDELARARGERQADQWVGPPSSRKVFVYGSKPIIVSDSSLDADYSDQDAVWEGIMERHRGEPQ
jgi:hypothetical protein